MGDLDRYFKESAEVKIEFIQQNEELLQEVIRVIDASIKNGNKLIICGNGGSAADAQHIAAEFTGRYKLQRKSLPAIALTTDTSAITAIWNDYSFDEIFSRQLEWLGNAWDVLLGISTSWNSWNIIKAIEIAKQQWIITIWLLGKWWGKIKTMVDYALVVPSDNTPRIQECHMTIYHTICEIVDILHANKTI